MNKIHRTNRKKHAINIPLTIDEKGRFLIPQKIRGLLEIKHGDIYHFTATSNRTLIFTRDETP